MSKFLMLFLFSSLLLLGCTQQQAQTPIAAPAQSPAAVQVGSVQEIQMTATRFDFNPATVTVKKGVPVKITIESTDVSHGFAIPEFNIQKEINPGAKTVVEFTPDKTGEFTFFCSVICGTGHGSMRGKLVVTE